MKDQRISVRVDSALKDRIKRIERATGLEENDLVRNCVQALCDAFDQDGGLNFPIRIESRAKQVRVKLPHLEKVIDELKRLGNG